MNLKYYNYNYNDNNNNSNKNGVLWSQTRMRIEMRLRCYFGHLVIGNWQFVIGNLFLAICNWQFVIGNWSWAIGNW